MDGEGAVRADSVHECPRSRERFSSQYDVFIDLTQSVLSTYEFPVYLESLARDAGLAGVAGVVTLALPDGWELPPAVPSFGGTCLRSSQARNALSRAICSAARSSRHLVVVLDCQLPLNEVLGRLLEEFDQDPLFGTVQPRFADAATDKVWLLPGAEQVESQDFRLSREALSLLPASSITTELLSVCQVIRREVVAVMDTDDQSFGSVRGQLRLLLTQARRRGFRNVVVNAAVLSSQLPWSRIYPGIPAPEMDRLRHLYSEVDRADAWNTDLPQRRLEKVLAGAFASDISSSGRLLLDCRGMISEYNGTSHCILGFLDGFHDLRANWQVHVLASSAAARFHRLSARYTNLSLVIDRPSGTYTAAVLLNQPWALSAIAELHGHALLVGFNMLDTISWDILYTCNDVLDTVWRFVARYADCLFYNSQFTRDRFKRRFPTRAGMAECVTYHSMVLSEKLNPSAAREPVGNNILVIGNEYDHKDVRRTLQLLVDAFPFNKIVAVGVESGPSPNVLAMPSGQIEPTALHRLIAGARVIVFPSFYEGFGLPVVEALAYGRPVIVRRSSLWHEIAAQLRMPGQLADFDSVSSLVELVGRALSGRPLEPLIQGAGLSPGQAPLRWQDCARRLVETLDSMMSNLDCSRWLEREEALRTIQVAGS